MKPKRALDHDYSPSEVLVPFGILDVFKEQLWIYFGNSKETSDFVVDCLEMWWKENSNSYKDVEELMIELDGGSPMRSNRTQFIKRMVEFSRASNLKIRLIYYPPYHSKYNTIERCWACLENHWNGAILDSIETAIAWAKNMTWKGIKPIVNLVNKTYEKGIIPLPEELELSKIFWHPSLELPSWDVTIFPTV
jgi:transposase